MIRLTHFCLATLFSVTALAQTSVRESSWQQANRQFDTQGYAKAISIYQEAFDQNLLSVEQQKLAQLNMAYSYFQLGDNNKAEEYYEKVIPQEALSGTLVTHYLHYAKVLANNGKMQESQHFFERYQNSKLTEDRQTQRVENYTRRKITYRLDYLAINTPNAEFSPMYYKDGLVFVSGKTAVSSESPEKGYLDLFYVTKSDEIKAVSSLNADGSETDGKEKKQTSPRNKRRLGSDAYTRPTSNDSRIVSIYNGYGLNEVANNSTGVVAKPGKPAPFSKELNTRFHEGPVTFSADGSRIIFTRNNFNEGKKRMSDDNNIKLKLYTAQWGGDDWTNVQELPFNSDEYSTAHPSLSKDGTLLYFVSDMPKGQGGKDIYVSRLENGRWGVPISMGKELNTRQDEVFPFVDERGNLYFSTSGRKGGLGGLDIYYAILSKDGTKVIEVIHLDAPINSKADDFGLVTDADRTTGYFSSNRQDENDDIYRFTRESSLYECRELLLRVFDNQNMQHLDSATITIRSKIGGDETNKTLQTDADGWAHLCLASDNDFVFTVSKDGFWENTIGFSTRHLTDDKPTRLEMSLSKPTIVTEVVAKAVIPEKKKLIQQTQTKI